MRRNPHVPERTATGLAVMMRNSDVTVRSVLLAQAQVASNAILLRIYHMLRQDWAAEEAMVSGALPGEFRKSELRFL